MDNYSVTIIYLSAPRTWTSRTIRLSAASSAQAESAALQVLGVGRDQDITIRTTII